LYYRIVVGADEAGYGPNLGPLLIATTAWSIPQNLTIPDFTSVLADCFRPTPWHTDCQHVPLGDSKQLYQPTQGLASLEAGLLALLESLELEPKNLQSLLSAIQFSAQPHGSVLEGDSRPPWYQGLDQVPVPSCHSSLEISRLASIAKSRLADCDIRLIGARAAVISEASFNAQVDLLGSKGQLLSNATLQLVRSFCEETDQPIEIFCDRQGGRKNYMPILLEAFPDDWFVETLRSNERCSYRNSTSPSREFHFTVGGDSFAPTALASMLCKYLRERLMESFNRFWCGHIPGLRPTAGYPLDAKRFRQQIETTARKLELQDALWWRSR
jgi:ribonuclease HII